MYQEQRLEEILKLLQENEVLTTEKMIEHFGVSRDTVRRDFSKLSNEGKVKRIHGGVMQLETDKKISSFNDRLDSFTISKKQIAEIANNYIQTDGTYFFDVSTIVLKLAQILDAKATIYTHSLDNSIMLSSKDNISLHLLGGKFFIKNRFFYSLNEAEILNNIKFDVAFIGAAGLKNGQVSFEDQTDAYLKQLVLKNAKRKIILAEESKFSKEATYTIGNLNDFDLLITDQKPGSRILSMIDVKYGSDDNGY
ncbi:DeoR/GlpR family DNA-binding transcription regulator [Companilactobacillus nuruki]|uniref:DeoR family transcriptional regulator n=1 Tax=Companilactobacillus nuruki TaxID=1993540 RepID=A0A2N7ARR5_9LACO|nr:DeoR/GlpR family DNA-binding transcription regulator [Companilactobacillus nuruki]PMD68051.1 DeoR family transcriptional regulator [Companilactobacillus nuruki]